MTARGRTAGALALLAASCAATRESWHATWNAPYGEFDRTLRSELEEARADMEAGRLEEAYRALRAARAAHPDNIELAVWTQEVELALVAEGTGFLPDVASVDGDPEELLRRRYEGLVYDQPSVAGYVLAARLEPDAIAAENLIENALALDPRCAWAHYGRAHALLQQRLRVDRWSAARESLSRALFHDPTHLRARRLAGWMAAQEGDLGEAEFQLESWLEETQGDVRATAEERIEAELDLALVWILDGRAKEAAALLRTLEGTRHERARRLTLVAVAAQELGDVEGALDAARRAEDAAPGSLLPLVQQALIHEHGRGDAPAGRAVWARVVGQAGGRGDLAAMLQSLRARVELERAAAPAEERAAE